MKYGWERPEGKLVDVVEDDMKLIGVRTHGGR